MRKDHRGSSCLLAHEVIGRGTRKTKSSAFLIFFTLFTRVLYLFLYLTGGARYPRGLLRNPEVPVYERSLWSAPFGPVLELWFLGGMRGLNCGGYCAASLASLGWEGRKVLAGFCVVLVVRVCA